MMQAGPGLSEAFVPLATDEIKAHSLRLEDVPMTVKQGIAVMGILPQGIRIPVEIGYTEQIMHRQCPPVQGFEPWTAGPEPFFQPDPVGQQVGIRQGEAAGLPDRLLQSPLANGHAIDIRFVVDTTHLLQQAPGHFRHQGQI